MALPPIRPAEEIEAALATRSFKHFVRVAWSKIDPAPLVWNWHVEAICDHLQAVSEGKIQKLIINVPPGHAKSALVSVLWPAWVWIRRPEWRVMAASYELGLVTRDAVKARELMRSDWYQKYFRGGKSPFSNCKAWEFTDDQDQKTFYGNSSGGFRVSLSVGGKGTGYRGDCLVGSTFVDTEHGPKTIKEIHEAKVKPKVWSVGPNGLELATVEASRVIHEAVVGDIVTVSGSVLRCTNDHRIASGLAYRSAQDLRKGDALYSSGRGSVLALQGGDRAPLLQSTKAVKAEQEPDALLFEEVRTGFESRYAHVPSVQRSDAQGQVLFKPEVLQSRMSAELEARETETGMPPMLRHVSTEGPPASLLLSNMRGFRSQFPNAGAGELSLQGWNELLEMVRIDAAGYPGTRRAHVSDMQSEGLSEIGHAGAITLGSGSASHRRESFEQQSGKLDSSLLDVSRIAPQIYTDAVAKPWEPCGGTHDVYDLQVTGGRNFFANSVLVHNCLLMDDVLKAGDAHSKLARENVIRWKTETMATRFNDPTTASEVLIMQRLHEDDLTGYLLRQGGWQHLCLASEFDPDKRSKTYTKNGLLFWEDPRNEKGELLFPQKFTPKVLEDLKSGRGMGSYAYAGQHQQNPVPADGGLIKREWFNRRYVLPGGHKREGFEVRELPKQFDSYTAWVDATFKKTDDSDRVAIGVIGQKGPDLYLLDLIWKQMGFVETVQALVDVRNRWRRLSGIYIEDKANGSAIIDTLKTKMPGIIGVEPDGGKESRIAAASPFIEAGNFWLPQDALWVDDFILEATSFPKAPHDDAIDMVAYALLELCGRSSTTFLEAMGAL